MEPGQMTSYIKHLYWRV